MGLFEVEADSSSLIGKLLLEFCPLLPSSEFFFLSVEFAVVAYFEQAHVGLNLVLEMEQHS